MELFLSCGAYRYFENRKLPEVVKGEQEEADKTGNEFDSDEEDAEIDAALQEALKDEGAMLGVDADGADDIDEAAFKVRKEETLFAIDCMFLQATSLDV